VDNDVYHCRVNRHVLGVERLQRWALPRLQRFILLQLAGCNAMKKLKDTFLLLVIVISGLIAAFLYTNAKTHHSSYGYVPGYEAQRGE
jgi:hypothetical protein